MISGRMKGLLQAEGAALFLAGLVGFHLTDVSWWMFIVLFFVPDVSFAAYLAGPHIGAYGYNILHSTIGPFLLAGLSWWLGGILGNVLLPVAIIWFAHVGFDRMLGYGLKHTSGFKDTHLGPIGRE